MPEAVDNVDLVPYATAISSIETYLIIFSLQKLLAYNHAHDLAAMLGL